MSDLNPPNRKDPKFLAAAILVGLVLVAGIVLIGVRTFNGSDSNAMPDATATATNKPTGSSSACGLPDGNQDIPENAPPTRWRLNGSMAAPTSKAYGPAKEANRVHECFARNPAGALFAAATFYTDGFGNKDVNLRAYLERWLANGPAKEQALKAVKPSEKAGDVPVPLQIAAFRVDDYTATRTTVTIVMRVASGPDAGTLRAWPTTVAWEDGDWRVSSGSSSALTPTRVVSLDGYQTWSGVS